MQANRETGNVKKYRNKETRNQICKFTNKSKRHKGHLIRL